MTHTRSNNLALPTLQAYALLPLRLLVGYGFLAHGLAKWSRGPAAFASTLQALHVPAPHLLAWVTILTEVLGGLLFLAGAFTRWVSVPACILLAVAVVTVHWPYGFSSIKLMGVVDGRPTFGPPGYECDLLYMAGIAALALAKPGPWSVDRYRLRSADRAAV